MFTSSHHTMCTSSHHTMFTSSLHTTCTSSHHVIACSSPCGQQLMLLTAAQQSERQLQSLSAKTYPKTCCIRFGIFLLTLIERDTCPSTNYNLNYSHWSNWHTSLHELQPSILTLIERTHFTLRTTTFTTYTDLTDRLHSTNYNLHY